MKHIVSSSLFCVALVALSACTELHTPKSAQMAPASDAARPVPRPTALAPPAPAGAKTAAAFDTTSAADRAAATNVTADSGGEKALGQTIASLGNPAQTGIWLETPLVSVAGPGRVVASANGKEVLVELIPIEGADGAGSRLSLAALRLLEIDLTGLHVLQVFAR